MTMHDLARQLYGEPEKDMSRLQNAAVECCDCGYRIIGDDGRQHDLLCFGRCLQCHMKWRVRSALSGD